MGSLKIWPMTWTNHRGLSIEMRAQLCLPGDAHLMHRQTSTDTHARLDMDASDATGHSSISGDTHLLHPHF